MDKIDASARLRALATGDKLRTDTARLRDVFDDVEAALNAGVSRVNVLAELQNLGYTMTLASFKSALQRIRKERNKAVKTEPQARSNSPAAPDVLDEATAGKQESLPEEPSETGKNSNRPLPLLSEEKGVWGQLKPSPIDGTVDLKQK